MYAATAHHATALERNLDGDPGVAEWRTAESAAAPFGAYYVLRPRLELVKALLEVGTREEARLLLHGLWVSAKGMGAGWFEREAVRLGRRHRMPFVGEEGMPRALAVLTTREREILAMLAAGATNKTIADRLYISPKTASVHVSHILAKLGVQNRGEAAAVARELTSAD